MFGGKYVNASPRFDSHLDMHQSQDGTTPDIARTMADSHMHDFLGTDRTFGSGP